MYILYYNCSNVCNIYIYIYKWLLLKLEYSAFNLVNNDYIDEML